MNFSANFDSEFFGLVFPGLQATQKIHAQNSRPELSAALSNFTFLNPKFIHGDFLPMGGDQDKVGRAHLSYCLRGDERHVPSCEEATATRSRSGTLALKTEDFSKKQVGRFSKTHKKWIY